MSEQNILQWAEQVELLPEGYRAISVRKASFAVGIGENPRSASR